MTSGIKVDTMQTCMETNEAFAAPVEIALMGERGFKALFDTISNPALIVEADNPLPPPDPMNEASGIICNSMLGSESTLWTDVHWQSAASYWLQYECQSSIVSEPCMAKYALITRPKSMPPLNQFRMGESEDIEPAITLVIQVNGFDPAFAAGHSTRLRTRPMPFFPVGLSDDFWAQRITQMRTDPRGVDILFTHGRQMMFLPGNRRINC